MNDRSLRFEKIAYSEAYQRVAGLKTIVVFGFHHVHDSFIHPEVNREAVFEIAGAI